MEFFLCYRRCISIWYKSLYWNFIKFFGGGEGEEIEV